MDSPIEHASLARYREPFPVARHRGKWRLWLGTTLYTTRRYLQWCHPGVRYAARKIQLGDAAYGHCIVHHATPLYRRLRNVDMWLQQNKVTNLKLAAAVLDGTVLAPGETFSFWRLVGRPTRRKGYKEGMVLVNGGFRPGVGGGLCQMSNLIYWMTLHTPLTVTERYRHQYDVFPDADRTLPFGSGATVAYNYIDLQIENRTAQTFVLRLHVTDKELQGQWWSDCPAAYRYEVYERNHAITQNVAGHYLRHNQIWRKQFAPDGTLLTDEMVTENHALMMYSPLLDAGQ
jgi:vancomycin resistance protein VanW